MNIRIGRGRNELIQLDPGTRFGHLVVIGPGKPKVSVSKGSGTKHLRSTTVCRCDCGNVVTVGTSRLRNGKVRACGCMRAVRNRERCMKHGLSHTRLMATWSNMKARVFRPWVGHNHTYARVTICQEWANDFKAFADWALANGYSDSLSIDRIDNSRGYCPENCRFVTMAEQARNKTTNVRLEVDGVLYPTMSLAAKAVGVSRQTLRKWISVRVDRCAQYKIKRIP